MFGASHLHKRPTSQDTKHTAMHDNSSRRDYIDSVFYSQSAILHNW